MSFLCDALVELTGVDQGDDAQAWQRWWNVVAADFVVASDRPSRPAPRPKTSTAYWGIPIRGQNLAFVVDLSGSMTAKLDGKTRLDVAKARLIEVLRGLGREHRFAVVAFGTDLDPFADGLSVATQENVEKAIKWVDRLRVRGATNIYDSLEFALAIPEVESVFLLTDGAPSTGKLVDMGEIRLAIRLQNAEQYVRVNTIQIGGGGREQAFLRGLAADNHGEARRR